MARIETVEGGNWDCPGTWKGGVPPGENDLAVIHHTVELSENKAVGAFILDSSGRLLNETDRFVELMVMHEGDYDGDGAIEDTSLFMGEIMVMGTGSFTLNIQAGRIIFRRKALHSRILEVDIED
jgi:hypothetical protein